MSWLLSLLCFLVFWFSGFRALGLWFAFSGFPVWFFAAATRPQQGLAVSPPWTISFLPEGVVKLLTVQSLVLFFWSSGFRFLVFWFAFSGFLVLFLLLGGCRPERVFSRGLCTLGVLRTGVGCGPALRSLALSFSLSMFDCWPSPPSFLAVFQLVASAILATCPRSCGACFGPCCLSFLFCR